LLAAPAVFDQADDNGVVVLLDPNPPESQRQAVEDAVRNCPTSAIKIVE
jgi:ferredoxin